MVIGQGLVLVMFLELVIVIVMIVNSGKQVIFYLFVYEINFLEMKFIFIGLKLEYVNMIKKGMIDVVEYGIV